MPRLPYTLTGPAAAPVVVMIHSIGMTRSLWDGQLPALRDRFRVLTYDQRGHGAAPSPPGPYSIADLGEDLIGLLDDLELPEVSLCGLSLGGMVAMWAAASSPDRISRVVLACTSAYPDNPAKWAERAERARREGMAGLTAGSWQNWFTGAFAQAHPDLVMSLRRTVERNPAEGYAACCEVLESLDLRASLHLIRSPALIIVGAQDRSFPLDHGRCMQRGIPGSRIAEIPDAAHLANVEQPDLFNELLLSYLAESRATALAVPGPDTGRFSRMPKQTWALTEADATSLIQSVIQSARDSGLAVSVAVVESGGNLIGLTRMDGAKFPSIEAATTKAWTSAMFQRPSGDYQETTAPGGASYGLLNSFPGQLAPVPGGEPLTVAGQCIGGIGVSGGTGEQDAALARAAAAALSSAGPAAGADG
jgi:3-oxoadipate enol-lactonase